MEAATTKMTLIEIVMAYREALWTVEELEGEILPGMEEHLEQLDEAFEVKVDHVLQLAQEFEAKAQVHKARAKAQTDAARVLTNQAERMREYVKTAMVGADVKKIETSNFPKVRLQRVAPKVEIEDFARFMRFAMDDGEDDLLRHKDPEPDKKAIKERLKTDEIPGCRMTEPGVSLRGAK